jgi:hypothetical protein
MVDKILVYCCIGLSVLALTVCAVCMIVMRGTVKSIEDIVDELTTTAKEKADAEKESAKTEDIKIDNEAKEVKVERKRFRLFRRKQKFDSSNNIKS